MGVAFHPNGHLAAIGAQDIGIIFWNLETDEVTQPVTIEGLLFGPSFSSDGQWLVFVVDTVVKLLDVETGDIVQEFGDSTAIVMAPDISPDDRLIVAGTLSPTVYIWDVETGELLQTFRHPALDERGWASAARFMADGRQVISGSTDGMMYRWDWQSGEILQTFEGGGTSPITISPDEQYIASGGWHLWSVETGEIIRTYEGHTAQIDQLTFSPDGQTILTASRDHTAILWDVWGVGFRYSIPLTPYELDSNVTISPTGERFAFVHGDGVIRVRDVASGEVVQAFGEHRWGVVALAYTPDGRFIISGYRRNETIDEPKAYVWDAETGELLHSLEEASSGFSVSFSPNGRIAAFSELVPYRITLWDTETWELLHILEGHLDWVLDSVFSPDGSILYSGSADHTIRIWDPHTGESLGVFAESVDVLALDITDDGERLLVGGGQQAVIFDTVTGQRPVTFAGPSVDVASAEFSPDDRYVLTGSYDGRLILWDAVTGQPVQSVVNDPPGFGILGVFTPDGQTIISGGLDDITVWNVPPLLQDYESWVVNNRYIPGFTCDQRALYAIEPLCE